VLDIFSGAMPTGALYYYVGCGTRTTIGTPVCLNGKGPHRITFCKPGNNNNEYRLRSLPRPAGPSDISVRDGCVGTLTVTGFDDSTVRWRSLTNSTAYNSFLSCASGCTTTTVTPTYPFPTYVDYIVSGRSANRCDTITVSDTVRVNFFSELEVSIIPDSPAVCYGTTTAVLTARPKGGYSPYSYLWSTGSTDSVITVGQGTFWVRLQDATNCPPVFDTVEVVSFTLPILAMAGNDTNICTGKSLPLNGMVQTASGGRWTGGTGTFAPDRNTLNAVYTPSAGEVSSGKVTLALLTTGNRTCPPNTDSITIHIRSYPGPLITGPVTVCERTGGHGYSTTFNSGSTYEWTVNGGVISSGQNTNAIVVNWDIAGSGDVNVTETNPYGCATTVNYNVSLRPRPAAVISGPVTVCKSTRQIYSVPAQRGSSYAWSVTNGIIIAGASTATTTVEWTTEGQGTISLKERNSLGCDSTVQITITIQPRPLPVITGPASVCSNKSPYTYEASGRDNSYAWGITGGRIIGGQGTALVAVEWFNAGKGNVTLKETNALGCDSIVSFEVTIQPKPVTSISGKTEVCQNQPGLTYSAVYEAGSTYQWTINGGYIANGAGTNNITVNWGKSGIGTVTLKLINYLGCDTTISLPVAIQARPMPVINGPANVCAGSVDVIYSVPVSPGSSYYWEIEGGNFKGNNITAQVSVDWFTEGIHTLRLKETNSLGCDTMTNVQVSVNPLPVPKIVGPEIVCENIILHKYSTTANTGSYYYWEVTGGAIMTGQGTSTIAIAWKEQNTGVIKVSEKNRFGCEKETVISVKIIDLSSEIVYDQYKICAPSPVRFGATPDSTILYFLWEFGDGGTSKDANPVHTYTREGSYTVRLISRNKWGCNDTALSTVTVYPGPQANFDFSYPPHGEKVFYILEDTTFFRNLSEGIKRYEWHFGDGTVDSVPDPTHMYTSPGTYEVK
ncbi:MAG: PKD domain-containing protein, partial [Bacteroidota bacterium]|nr:PKD domain-containing protein [Bacteroidota bacterium]